MDPQNSPDQSSELNVGQFQWPTFPYPGPVPRQPNQPQTPAQPRPFGPEAYGPPLLSQRHDLQYALPWDSVAGHGQGGTPGDPGFQQNGFGFGYPANFLYNGHGLGPQFSEFGGFQPIVGHADGFGAFEPAPAGPSEPEQLPANPIGETTTPKSPPTHAQASPLPSSLPKLSASKPRKTNDSSALKDLLCDRPSQSEPVLDRPSVRITPQKTLKQPTSDSEPAAEQPAPQPRATKQPKPRPPFTLSPTISSRTLLDPEPLSEPLSRPPPPTAHLPNLTPVLDLLTTRLVKLEAERAALERCLKGIGAAGDRVLSLSSSNPGVERSETRERIERSVEAMVLSYLETRCPEAADIFRASAGLEEAEKETLDVVGLREYFSATRFMVSRCLEEKEKVGETIGTGKEKDKEVIGRAERLLQKAKKVVGSKRDIGLGDEKELLDDMSGLDEDEEEDDRRMTGRTRKTDRGAEKRAPRSLE